MGLGARAAVSSDGPEGPLPSAQAADALESRAAMTVASSPVLSSSFSYRGLQAAPPFFPVGFFALSWAPAPPSLPSPDSTRLDQPCRPPMHLASFLMPLAYSVGRTYINRRDQLQRSNVGLIMDLKVTRGWARLKQAQCSERLTRPNTASVRQKRIVSLVPHRSIYKTWNLLLKKT